MLRTCSQQPCTPCLHFHCCWCNSSGAPLFVRSWMVRHFLSKEKNGLDVKHVETVGELNILTPIRKETSLPQQQRRALQLVIWPTELLGQSSTHSLFRAQPPPQLDRHLTNSHEQRVVQPPYSFVVASHQNKQRSKEPFERPRKEEREVVF